MVSEFTLLDCTPSVEPSSNAELSARGHVLVPEDYLRSAS